MPVLVDARWEIRMSQSTVTVYPCPVCRTSTDSLKHYEFPQLLFLLFGASHRVDRVTACPACLRQFLFRWAAVSLVTANLLWPVIVFPLFVSRLFASFMPGSVAQRKTIGKKIAGFVVGLLLVIAGFAVFLGIVLIFGPYPSEGAMTAVISVFAVCVLGLLGALVDL